MLAVCWSDGSHLFWVFLLMLMDPNLTSNMHNSNAGEDGVCTDTYTNVCVSLLHRYLIWMPQYVKLNLAALACCDASFVLLNQLAEEYTNNQPVLLTFSYSSFPFGEIRIVSTTLCDVIA